jgi:hypothetical protein
MVFGTRGKAYSESYFKSGKLFKNASNIDKLVHLNMAEEVFGKVRAQIMAGRREDACEACTEQIRLYGPSGQTAKSRPNSDDRRLQIWTLFTN